MRVHARAGNGMDPCSAHPGAEGKACAHGAGGRIGPEAHPVPWFAGGAQGYEHVFLGHVLGAQEPQGMCQQPGHGRQASMACASAGQIAAVRSHKMNAAFFEQGHVGLGGRIGPHERVHGRCHGYRACKGQNLGTEHVRGCACGHAGEETGRSRCHQQGLAGLAWLKVGKGLLARKHFRIHGGCAQGRKEQRRDKVFGSAAQSGRDMYATGQKVAQKIRALVAGNGT